MADRTLAQRCLALEQTRVTSSSGLNHLLNGERAAGAMGTMLEAFVAAADGPAFVKDASGAYVIANAALARTLGVAGIDALIGRRDEDVVPGRLAAENRASDLAAITAGAPVMVEQEIDGRVFRYRKTSWRTARGAPAGIAAIAQDLTETRRQAALLRESEALLGLTQEVGRVGIGEWLVQAGTMRLSPQLMALCGLAAFDGLYASWCDCIFHEDRVRVVAQFEEAFAAVRRDLKAEFRIAAGSGADLKWIEARSIVFYDLEQRPIRVVSVSIDVTEQKHAVLQLRAFTETLEERVWARTRELEAGYAARQVLEEALRRAQRKEAEELRAVNVALEGVSRQLVEARDEAERASQAKSRFLAAMSHELRTPLNGILGYAELLRREGSLSAAQGARVDAMLGAGTHLLKMINRVLDLSEIEAEHVTLQSATVDLRSLAAACLDLVRPAAEAKGLVLSMTAADAPLELVSDPTRLRQVVLNLLANAVKFTAAGSVELRLWPLPEGAGLRIDVADTGPGISESHRHRLFHEFERLDANATVTEGAGLGLALSARLATLLGGRLGYEDRVGGGSVFWLELPPSRSGIAAAIAPAESAMPAGSTRVLQVLVVDDMAMNRDIAASFLRASGHQVVCAPGGVEAIAAAGAAAFDVILMDVRMPGMDGLEATRRIRAQEGGRGRVPIVALTAQVFSEQIAECHAAGMDAHLAKPFTPDLLLETVVRAARLSGVG